MKAEELAELEGGEAEAEGDEDAEAPARAKRCKGKTESQRENAWGGKMMGKKRGSKVDDYCTLL